MASLPIPTSSAPPPPLRRGSGASEDTASRTTGIAVAFVMHAGLLAALWSYVPARNALLEHAPIVVELLTPPRVEPPPAPPPAPARPAHVAKPQPAPHPAPPPVVATPPADTPAPWTVAPQPPTPPAPAPVEPAPAIAAPAAPPAPPAPPEPVAAVPPRFDADYLRNPAPDYPAMSKRRGEQGRVYLRVLVSADGDARTVEIRTSSGYETLDRTAVDTVRRWRFVPARLGTTPVEAWVIVPLSFQLTR